MADKETKCDQPSEEGWPIFALWKKYEDITMHFNDLLIRLRTQALAAVAALATIIGIFAKETQQPHTSWEMVAFAFFFLFLFWIAVWVIDFRYYNRLLAGAVYALLKLEEQSKEKLYVRHIDMSTNIEEGVAGFLPKNPKACQLNFGRWFFYSWVALTLAGGFSFALYQTLHTSEPQAQNQQLNPHPKNP